MINHGYSDFAENVRRRSAGPPVMEEARYEAVMPLPGEYDAVDARRANIGAFKRATKSAFASGRL